jgi:regulator of sigma E protease
LARAATLFAGPAMNALLAVVLFAASFMAGFPAIVGYPQVTALPPGSVAAAAGVQEGDVLIRLNDQPVQVSAALDIQYDLVQEQTAGQTLQVLRAGELVELPLAAAVGQTQLLEGLSYAPVMTTEVTRVEEASPAAEAQLQPGDLIYAVEDITISANNPLNEVIQRFAGHEISLSILRNGELVSAQVTPRLNPPAGQGALGVQIGPPSRLATLSLPRALWEGVGSTLEYVVLVLQLPVLLFIGQVSPADAQLTGPVGIAQMVGGAVNATLDTGLWFPIWRLSAVLSAALAITNLLPLPALDGGRLLFILVEAIRGRRVNPEREGFIHMVGFMLLLGLLVLVTVRDITSAQQGIDWISILGQ